MIARYTLKRMGEVWSEKAKWDRMLEVEKLSCEAWAGLGIIPKKAAEIIRSKARYDIDEINEIEKTTNHDVIAFVESIARHLGEEGRWVHYGLTSSDVQDTALAAGLRDACAIIIEDLKETETELIRLAKEHRLTPVIGRTHGIHAEPTSLGLKFALWLEETRRNMNRMKSALEEISVGKLSGAVGSYANIDPHIEEYVLSHLGLKVEPVSTQIVQRDRHAFLLSVIALIAGMLEKAATEIRNLQRTDIRELEEGFAKGQKGSSAMPHKRNPITCERICGCARVIRGYMLTAHEDITLWHERDLTHSSAERIILPDAFILLDYILNKFVSVLKNLNVYPENTKKNLMKMKGLACSGTLLLLLVEKGVKREDAYVMVQRNAMRVWAEDRDFKELILADADILKHLKPADIDKAFDYGYYMRNVDIIFKRIGLL
jgi:adenylosuccinate lyase